MIISTESILSVSEVNKNFSRATRVAENNGRAIIFKNNKPKYMLIDLEQETYTDFTDDEIITIVSNRILNTYRDAYLELAK